MFKKDSEILNLKQELAYQKEYIEDLEAIRDYYRIMSREQRDTIDKQDKIIKRKDYALRNILELTEANRYGNGEVIFSKINKLAKTPIQY